MGRARAAKTLALPAFALGVLAVALGGCVETRPFTASGIAPKGPATYQIIGADMLAKPVRAALDARLAERGLKPSDGETADYFVSLGFSDRPLGIGTFGGDQRPAKQDPRWIDGPERSGKRERRVTIRFVDKTGAGAQTLVGTEIVPRRSAPARIESLVGALFAASQ